MKKKILGLVLLAIIVNNGLKANNLICQIVNNNDSLSTNTKSVIKDTITNQVVDKFERIKDMEKNGFRFIGSYKNSVLNLILDVVEEINSGCLFIQCENRREEAETYVVISKDDKSQFKLSLIKLKMQYIEKLKIKNKKITTEILPIFLPLNTYVIAEEKKNPIKVKPYTLQAEYIDIPWSKQWVNFNLRGKVIGTKIEEFIGLSFYSPEDIQGLIEVLRD